MNNRLGRCVVWLCGSCDFVWVAGGGVGYVWAGVTIVRVSEWRMYCLLPRLLCLSALVFIYIDRDKRIVERRAVERERENISVFSGSSVVVVEVIFFLYQFYYNNRLYIKPVICILYNLPGRL